MNKRTQHLLPSAFELWCVVAAAVAILVAGNARIFLQRYGMIKSSTIVRQQLSHGVGSSLGKLDNFSFTPSLITFLVWGVIGLVAFSMVQAFLQASGMIKFERDLSSNRYVHPQNFRRDRYWKRVITDAVVSFLLLVLLAVGAGMYLFFVIPVGFTYAQRFLLQVSAQHLIDLGLGIFTVVTGTIVLYCLVKLVIWHHRISLN